MELITEALNLKSKAIRTIAENITQEAFVFITQEDFENEAGVYDELIQVDVPNRHNEVKTLKIREVTKDRNGALTFLVQEDPDEDCMLIQQDYIDLEALCTIADVMKANNVD